LKDNKILDGDSLAKAQTAIETVANWTKSGFAPKMTEYPASIALFTSGKAAMHINGVWEVPTMVDLAAKGKLGFDWGAIQIPTLFAHPATWADSHSFAIPNNAGKEITPEKLQAVMTVIGWMNKNSQFWATGGHIPAYLPVTDSDAFKTLQPNAVYSSLTKTEVLEPKSIIAGVASPTYDAAGNYLIPGEQGDMDPKDAAAQLQTDLQALLK
jgi:multiple sugar transport system substrate-binding protein